ncbi:MAG: phospho-N-acetylmuramoyl-pentapeptide-transferase [Planctomycetota bacterium]
MGGPEGIADLWAAAAAAVTACLAVTAFAPPFLTVVGRRCGEKIKSASVRLDTLQRAKAETPTMGGLIVVAGVTLAAVVWGDVGSVAVRATLLAFVGFAAIGACDDVIKLRSSRRGLSPRQKSLMQAGVAVAVVVPIVGGPADATASAWCLHFAWVAWGVFVVVGSSNGVNLTDGMDGLAGGCAVTAATGLTFAIASAGGESGEVAVVTAALAGGLLGFLRFNRFPARVFMGDTGALAVGGAIGTAAVATRCEWLLAVCGGVFVVETLSVIAQVAGRDLFGRKPLLCSPLHNHFLFAGVAEPRIVARFWAASAALTTTALAVLRFV